MRGRLRLQGSIRSLTPCGLARRLSPLIAACSSLASVGKVMAFGCTERHLGPRAEG